MEEKALALNVDQYGLEPSRAKQIEAIFAPMTQMLYKLESSYNDVMAEAKNGIDYRVEQTAKRLRLDIAKIRIETEKLRKKEKEEFLRGGKAIDGISNILKFAVVKKENDLKEIEETSLRIEKEKIEKLQSDRVTELEKYIDEVPEIDFSSMPDTVWSKYKDGYKLDYEKRIEAEKQVEIDRIAKEKADLAEQNRIKAENEKLRKEAVERDKLQKIEDEKREKEKIAREKKEATDQAKRDAEETERLRLQKIEDEKREKALRLETEKRELAEKQISDKELAEKKEKQDKIDEEKAVQAKIDLEEKSKSLAPDKEKLIELASTIAGIQLPIVANKEAIEILNRVKERLEKTYSDLINHANNLD